MLMDFSICEAPVNQDGITLDVVFHIRGDRSYNVPKKAVKPGKTYAVFTLQGEGTVLCEDRTHKVVANTFLYLQPQTELAYCSTGGLWEFWWFEFWGGCPCEAEVLHTMEADLFHRELMQKIMAYSKQGCWDIAALLLKTLNQIAAREADSAHKRTPDQQRLAHMEAYIRDSQGMVAVHDLAKVFSMDERTLRNLFHSCTGLSPKQVITKIRMEYAGSLLSSTDLSLEKVAQQTGYSSQYHFSRAFKAFYGVAPMHYRRYTE